MAHTPELFVSHVSTPLGVMRLTSSEDFLISASFPENEPETDSARRPDCLLLAARQVQAYFNGKSVAFDLPLQEQGTPFQQKVWQALQQIPAGRTDHYLGLAQRLGNPGAVRAVGAANGANPFLVIVPCHRIIGAQGQLVGYAGGLWRKKWLLEHEAKLAGSYQTTLF